MRTKTPEQAEKILTVAARFFARQRFHEARMEDIAATAGVGKGTLYRYFKDKEELYLALLALAADQFSKRLQEASERDHDPRLRLEAMVEAILTYFDEQPHLFDLIQHAEALVSPDRQNPWQETRHQTMARFQAVFADGADAGVFHFADPEIAGLLLMGGLRSVIRFGTRPRPTDVASRIIDSFLHGHAVNVPARIRQKANAG